MADEEISSLLLRVGVDFAAIEAFVETMPAIVQVAEQVGTALNATQIGSPELFARKGAELGRAITTGFAAELGGVNFEAAGGLASVLTRQVFGTLNTDEFARYAQQIQTVINGIQVGQIESIFPQDAVRQLQQFTAAGLTASTVVDRLNLSLERLGKSFGDVQRLGGAEYSINTPQGAFGIQRVDQDRGRPQYAVTNPQQREVGGKPDETFRRFQDAVASVQGQLRTVQTVLQEARQQTALPATPVRTALPAGTGQTQQQAIAVLDRALGVTSRGVESAGARLSRAVDATARQGELFASEVFGLSQTYKTLKSAEARVARENASGTLPPDVRAELRPRQEDGRKLYDFGYVTSLPPQPPAALNTITPAGELFSRQEVATQAAQVRGQVDIFQAVAEAQAAQAAAPIQLQPTVPVRPRLASREEVARLRAEADRVALSEADQGRVYDAMDRRDVGQALPGDAELLAQQARARAAKDAYIKASSYTTAEYEAQEEADRLIRDRVPLAARALPGKPDVFPLYRGETSGIGIGEGQVRDGLRRQSDDGSRYFTPNPAEALGYATLDSPFLNMGGPRGRLLSVQVSKAELESLRTTNSNEVVLGPEVIAQRARTLLEGPNDTLRAFQTMLAGGTSGPGLPFLTRALPPGTGAFPTDFTDRVENVLRRFPDAGFGPAGDLRPGTRVLPGTGAALAPPFRVELLGDEQLRALAALRTSVDPAPRQRDVRKVYDQPDETQFQADRFGQQSSIDRLNTRVSTRNRQREAERDARQAALDEESLPLANQAQNLLTGREQTRRLIETGRETQARYDAQQAALEQARSQQRTVELLRPVRAQMRAEEEAARARLTAEREFQQLVQARLTPTLVELPEPPKLIRGGGPPLQVDQAEVEARRARNEAAMLAAGLDPAALRAQLAAQANALSEAVPAPGAKAAVGPGNPLQASAPEVQQRLAEITYLRNVRAAQQLDEALARLEQQLNDTTRAASRNLGANSALLGNRQGVSSLLGGPLTTAVGIGSARDARLQDALAALEPTGAQRRALTGGPAPIGPQIPEQRVDPAQERARRLNQQIIDDQRVLNAATAAGGAGGGGRVPPPTGGGGGGGFGTPPPLPRGGAPIPPPQGGGQSFFGQARQFARDQFADENTFFGGVSKGFSGGEDGGGAGFFGRSVGSAARFALVYGAAYSALRLFTTGFAQGIQGATEFETALTNLNIATERTGRSNEAFAFELSDLGASRGVGPGESVEAGARAIGLFGATDAPRVDQEEIARVSTDVASKIAFISGQTVEAVQTQVAGITRSFNVDPLDQERVFDVASFVGRRSGRPAGELLQSLGQIGSLGGDAGFSLEQTAAIISQLTSTTGQTPQAVSGFLSQVLSRADDPRLQQRLRSVGVETEGTTLAQQIEQLSGLNLPQSATNQIVSGFGRGRSGQALGIILEQFPQIQALAEGASGATGLGQRDFEQAVNNVGGQIRVLGASLKDLFTGLASTGVLDIFVLLLSAAQGLVEALDALVDVFNLIPREARSAAIMLLEVYGALLLLSKIPVVNAFAAQRLLNRGGTAVPGAAGAAAGATLDPNSSRTSRVRAVGSAIAGGVGGVVGAGAAAVGGTVGAGAVAGGLLLGAAGAAVLVGTGIWRAFAEAAASERDILEARQSVFGAVTTEDFDAAKSDIDAARQAVDERDDFKLLSKDSLSLGLANAFDDLRGTGGRQRAELDRIEEERARRAELVEQARASAVDRSPGAAFDGFVAGQESVSGGLSVLAEKGFTATAQLAALNQAFDAVASKSEAAAGSLGVVFAGQIDSFALEASAALTNTGNEFAAGRLGADARRINPLAVAGNREQAQGGILNFFQGATNDLGRLIGLNTLPTRNNIIEDDMPSFLGLVKGAFNEFNPAADNDRERAVRIQSGAKEIDRVLADTGVQNDLSGVVSDVLRANGKDPALGAVTISESDREQIVAGQKAILERNLGKPFDELDKKTREAFYSDLERSFSDTLAAYNGERVTADTAAAFLTGVRQTAGAAGEERALRTGDDLAGATFTRQSLEDARARARETLTDSGATREDRTAAIRAIELLDLDILRAEASEVDKRNARIDALVGLQSAQLAGDPLQQALISIGGIQAKLQGGGLSQEERLGLQTELENQGQTFRRAQVSTRTAQDRAAVDPRDSVGNAEATLRDTQRQLAIAIPGTEGFYTALRSVNEAQVALADANLQAAQAALFVGLDPQDTVAQADAALAAARLKLEASKRPIPLATALSDFDTAGNQVGTVDVAARGKGIGAQVLQGLLANNYTGAGASAARQLIAGFLGASRPGVLPNAPQTTAGQGSPNAVDRRAANQAAGFDFAAATPGRQGQVLLGGSLATSGRFAPRPGQLTGANRGLAELIQASGASFGKLDGNIVPRATADGGISSHSFGNALDIFGTPAELAALAAQLTPLAGNGLKELIYTPTNTFLGKDGKRFKPSANVRANHRDHIHAQVDDPAALQAAAAAQGIPISALGTTAPSQAEIDANQVAVDAAARDAVLARQATDISRLNSTLDPRNSNARAVADLRIANRVLRDESGNTGTQAYYDALTGVNNAKLALARTEAARAYALDQANATRAQSPLANAASTLRVANDRLRNEVAGTKEYYEALADQYRAAQQFAEATREAQGVSLRLSSDITDPVEQLTIDLRTAQSKRQQVRRNGGDQAAIEQADLEARQVAVNLEQARFDQRLSQARTDFELRRSSSTAYVAFLKDEESRLGAIKNRTVQQQGQYDQVQRELQNLNKQLTGQFNIGDIKIPTPYDARRLLAEREVETPDPFAGGGVGFGKRIGGLPTGVDPALAQAGSFSQTSGAIYNNQQTTTTNANIVINGGNIDEVKAVLTQFLGASAFQRTSTSTAKV